MHASVVAHSFGVRLLTQCVRLPVPDETELDRPRALAEDYTILYYTILYYTILYYTILYYTILYYTILKEYEGMSLKDILRVPLWKQQLQSLNAAYLYIYIYIYI